MTKIKIPADLAAGIEKGLPWSTLCEMSPGKSTGDKAAFLQFAYDYVSKVPSGIRNMKANNQILAPTNYVIDTPSSKHATAACVENPATLKGRQVTLILSDLHAQMHRIDLMEALAKLYQGARLVIAGDLLDNEVYSQWNNYSRSLTRNPQPGLDPLAIIQNLATDLTSLSGYFTDISILFGNHDEWIARAMAKNSKGTVDLVDRVLETELSGIPNCTIAKGTTRDRFMLKRGDVWIGHWHTYGKPTNKGAEKAVEWMLNQQEIKAMGPWEGLVQAHTHKVAFNANHLGKWCGECGSMTLAQDYQDAKPGRTPGSQLGYAVITQYDGVLSKHESGFKAFDDIYYIQKYDNGGPISADFIHY